jgi:hypothetical protein
MTMTRSEVAEVVFRRSESWLIDHTPADFPEPSADYGLFATAAVRAWVNRHWHIADGADPVKDGEEEFLRRIANGKRQSAASNRTAA